MTRAWSADDLAELFAPGGGQRPTDEQRAIIQAELHPAAIVAGAGSGKTETMAARVVWLVANGRVEPDRVLGLTFTRKAAAELGDRVRRRLAAWRATEPDAPAGEPTVLTYAAYAGRLVTEHAVRIGREPVTRRLSAAADWQLARDTVTGWRGPLPETIGQPGKVVADVLALAGRLADHLVDPADVLAVDAGLVAVVDGLPRGRGGEYPKGSGDLRATAVRRAALLPLVGRFLEMKTERGARDFADEMALAAELAALPEVGVAERDRFGAVLLDEYQDTGFAQVQTLRLLFAGGHPVTAVGDPLQSIYGWRGASAGTMAGFATAFPLAGGAPAPVHKLQTSWRNDRTVLDVANAVAAPLQQGATGVTLVARETAGPGLVRAWFAETNSAEAEGVAARLREAWDALPGGTRTAAVLVRKRSQIPLLEQALRAAGLPVEVVDLGGLLTVPEVADVYATLKVVSDHTAGVALVRLLTGARWRIGVADLRALQDRARRLVPRLAAGRSGAVPAAGPAAAPVPAADDIAGPAADPVGETAHLVEALDDLGPAEGYSAVGYERLHRLQGELRRLRGRAAAPLPELVADVEHVLGLDVEIGSRPDADGRPDRGRAQLDRFHAEVAKFAGEVDRANLAGLVAFLTAAEDEENGLAMGDVVVDPERVQILTVHGSKGLEWDVVAVPGLATKLFPGATVDNDWVRAPTHLPDPVRGDRDHIPRLDVRGVETRNDVGDRFAAYHKALAEERSAEERRLAYVATTRARRTLLLSGFAWDHTTSARTPSAFLTDAVGVAGVVREDWYEPEEGAVNPLVGVTDSAWWPFDPLGPRRADVEAGAALVRAAIARAGEDGVIVAPASVRAEGWARDAELLLAERDRQRADSVVEVRLPDQLSVSGLVALRRDPQAYARSLRRRMPQPPNLRARRGTAFHEWLERRWLPKAQALLDVDELPGAADESVTDPGETELAALRAAFEASAWAAREPDAVEVPFETVIAGRVVRGRMDAVFGDGTDADGNVRWLVVDWKTGAVPSGDAADAAAVQLAAYRLAWADLQQIPRADVGRVRAAFHYVAAGVTVQPADLLDAAALEALVVGPVAVGG